MSVVIFLGVLSAYALNPTVGTISIRQEWGQLPADLSGYDVFLSVPDCGLIGHEATMAVGQVEYDALIFDCAGPASHDWMIDYGVAAEVDYHFWIAHPELVGTNTEVEIRVH